ncbi:hypothetical protein [Roseibium sp. SCP14]|uniref:hypothetical protein n=1 Tax=Roseibium sp. SCP14 TaxID=3141375 RepID=UPI00333AFE2E
MKYAVAKVSIWPEIIGRPTVYSSKFCELEKSDFEILKASICQSVPDYSKLPQHLDAIGDFVEPITAVVTIFETLFDYKITINSDIAPKGSNIEHYLFITQPEDNGGQVLLSFGDHLDEVKSALCSLSEYLRGINDPDILTAELKTARSYIDASLCFFDDKKYPSGGPTEVPAEIAEGLNENLKKTDWSKISSEARAWVQVVVKTLEAWFKSGS